jgi:hypothetical protein
MQPAAPGRPIVTKISIDSMYSAGAGEAASGDPDYSLTITLSRDAWTFMPPFSSMKPSL